MTVRFIPVLITAINTPVMIMPEVPALGGSLAITNGSSVNPIFLGQSSNVSVTNGAVIPPYGYVRLESASSELPIYVVAGAIDSGGTAVGAFYSDTQTHR